jgi:hypothetical protein
MGEASSRPSLRPHSSGGRRILKSSGEACRENEGACENARARVGRMRPDLLTIQLNDPGGFFVRPWIEPKVRLRNMRVGLEHLLP